MNSTPPRASSNFANVCVVVWFTYPDNKSDSETSTNLNVSPNNAPRSNKILPIKRATVVLPVPGFPINNECNTNC